MPDTTPDAAIDGDQPAAAHALINITEDLARYLRVVSGGMLTLAVVHNTGATLRERAGMSWSDAHAAADRTAGTAGRREVLAAQAAILHGEGDIGRHIAAHIDQVAPAAPAAGA